MAMGERVDVLIFGASGFTGKYVLREFLKFNQVQIAIAGRSESKLVEALKWASKSASPPQIPIFQADINKPDSLARICSVTRLLVSCVGPFRLYGEPVVKACVEAGIDYLDITGEPEFMERMEAAYHSKALENGSLVVSACGYDSIPAELGLIFNSRQWVPPSVPNSVDSYLVLHSSGRIRGNIGTYESAVLGIASARELQKLRASRPRRPRLQVPGPGPKKLSLVHWEENSGTWALKLPSADAIVVRRTMATMAAYPQGLPAQEDEEKEDAKLKRQKAWETLKPVHFGVFISLKKLWHVVAYIIFGAFFLLMANFKLGRDLLLRYPEFFTAGVFSKDGPSEEEVKNASFSMWFVGNGFSDSSKIQAGKKPDQQIVTRITGPEIGYVTTPIVLVQAALVVLTSRKSLPKGGVLTPGAVFGITDLQERLQKNGISFDVVSIKSI